MSRWNDQFQSHSFRTSWNTLTQTLADEALHADIDETSLKELARIKKVVKFVESILAQVDPELMPIGLLDSFNQNTTNCLSQLNSFITNKSGGNLVNANTYLDSIITLLSQTPFILSGQQKGALSKAALSYSETINQQIQVTETSVNKIKEEVTNIETLIQERQKNLDSLKSQIDTATQTIQSQSADFATQFKLSEIERNNQSKAVINKADLRINEEIGKLNNKIDGEFEKMATKAGKALDVLGKFQDDAAKVFNVVVNTLQAGAYSSYAHEEKKIANYLRWSAIGLMLTGVFILTVPEIYKIISNIENYSLDWRTTLARIPYSLILFVPAFYLARESNKHRNTEVQNKRRELILSTIDPYLALLPEEKAEQIKLDVAKGIFSENVNGDGDSSTAEAGNLIALITNLAKQLKG